VSDPTPLPPTHVNTGGGPAFISPDPSKWSLGLTGIGKIVANATAVAIVFILFWQSQQTLFSQAREDRTMFRDELKVMHDDSARKWEAINRNQQATTAMTVGIQETRSATVDLTGAIKTLTEEVRKLKEETQKKRQQDGAQLDKGGAAVGAKGGPDP
jgi:hypothetical protein